MSGLVEYLPVVWVLVVVASFASFSHPRRAVLFAVLAGTLFLPEALPTHVAIGPFHFTKAHALAYAALLGALLYDAEGVLAGRPRWVDVPMLVWCLCPLPSVLANDPPPDGSSSARDAFAQTWTQVVEYGIPYLLGRVYFCDRDGVRDLAMGVVLAAAVYTPLCLFEVRMSPTLHARVFGYSQHTFGQTIRFGGYRPMVFLPHGLALGFFMAAAALVAGWMWRTGEGEPDADAYTDRGPSSRWLWWAGQADAPGAERTREPLGYATLLLVPTVVLMKSTGALALGLAGAAALVLARATGLRAWLVLLLAVPLVYVPARATGAWSGESLVRAVAANIEADRAASLEFRLTNEDLLVGRALERPAFGWGGWGRNRVCDAKSGRDLSVTDGLWVIVLGDRGLVGLCALGAALLLPVARFAAATPAAAWAARGAAPAAALAVVLTLWSIDSLFNAMALPLYPLIAGAVGGLPGGSDPQGADG